MSSKTKCGVTVDQFAAAYRGLSSPEQEAMREVMRAVLGTDEVVKRLVIKLSDGRLPLIEVGCVLEQRRVRQAVVTS